MVVSYGGEPQKNAPNFGETLNLVLRLEGLFDSPSESTEASHPPFGSMRACKDFSGFKVS